MIVFNRKAGSAYFIIPTVADFSFLPLELNSSSLAVFLLYLEILMPPLGRAKHKISEKPGKGIKKQIGLRARRNIGEQEKGN
jgi:hypothetical protein